VYTAEVPGVIEGQNPSWSVLTDRNQDPVDNVPVSIEFPDGPWQNTQHWYHLLFRPTGELFAGSSDAAGPRTNGSPYYNDRSDFAVKVTNTAGVLFLLPAHLIGAQFRPLTTLGRETDHVNLPGGPFVQVPLDGMVPATTGCMERSVVHEPTVIPEVKVGTETSTDVPHPSMTLFGECKTLSREEWSPWEKGDVEDVRARVVVVTPSGQEMIQLVEPKWTLDGNVLYLRLDIGLTEYGRTVIRSITFDATEDPDVDRVLRRNAEWSTRQVAPLEVDAAEGPIGSDGCIPAGTFG
jgi:hypothetical protein